jgi:subtilase family serine protease
MRSSLKYIAVCLGVLIIPLACIGLSEAEKLQTAVAQTITASAEDGTPPEEQPLPTITLAPTATQPGDPTVTPKPCNDANFVSETVEDGTDFEPNENFTKTWRVLNAGTCTWNTNYKIVFVSGDGMSGPASKNLTQSVNPGEQIDLSVDLKAPGSVGEYEGIWNLADPNGNHMLNYISVNIEVIEPAAPPEKADLIVTEFSLNPNPPDADENVHVRVSVKNQGETNAGAFKVKWYGLDTFANPSCSWNVAGGLAADDSILLECDFIFQSWYPHNKTTIVYVDTEDAVDESNEGNNTATMSSFGVNP